MNTKLIPLVALSLVLAGCGDASDTPSDGTESSPLAAFWASSAPADAKPVLEVKNSAQSGDEVVVTGRVKDFNSGLSAFTLIDSTLKSCKETKDDMCKTPWDYCCVESDLVAAATISIELHDADDRPFRQSLKGFQDLDHLQTVQVAGKVTKDDAGNVRIAATTLYRE